MNNWWQIRASVLYNKVYEWICSCLLFISMIVVTFLFSSNIERLWISIKSFGLNLAFYFTQVFSPDVEFEAGVLVEEIMNVKGSFDDLNILPVNLDVFISEILTFLQSFIDLDLYADYFVFLLPVLQIIAQVITILLPVFLIFYILFSRYTKFHENELEVEVKALSDKVGFDEDELMIMNRYIRFNKNNSDNEETLFLKKYKKFRSKIILPCIFKIRCFLNYLFFDKFGRIYLFTYLLLFAFSINLTSVVIDILSWYLYFAVSMNFMSLLELLFINLIDLAPFLVKVPDVIYALVFYIIFDKIRLRRATILNDHMVNYDTGFVSSLGVATFIKGSPGTGKTKLMSVLSVLSGRLIRNQAGLALKKIRIQFPHFPFLKLEKTMDYLISCNKLKNRFHCEDWMVSVINYFIAHPEPDNLFGYDFINEPMQYDNGLKNETLFDALIDYAQIYFIYQTNSSLISSNYPIRDEGKLVSKGYSKEWTYNFFGPSNQINYANNSHIVNFDSWRLKKKMDPSLKNLFINDFGVLAVQEGSKERRNQHYTKYMDLNDNAANQLNDGFNDYFSTKRHDATIRYQLYYREFMDAQREEDLPANLKELHEHVITIRSNNEPYSTNLMMFWLEPLICSFILKIIDMIDSEYRFNRNKNTLFIYFLRSIALKINNYLDKRTQMFDYKRLSLIVDDGIEKKELYFYELKMLSHRDRYSTDSLRGFYKPRYMEMTYGFADMPIYSSIRALNEEFMYQNSYMIMNLSNDLANYTTNAPDYSEAEDITYY